jgi:hypothetical protein
MTSEKRVFANPTEVMHYNEYVKNKNALVMLATIKHNCNFVQNYRSYDEFIKLSKIYSKQFVCNDDDECSTGCVTEFNTNLYNANNSYINNRHNHHHSPHHSPHHFNHHHSPHHSPHHFNHHHSHYSPHHFNHHHSPHHSPHHFNHHHSHYSPHHLTHSLYPYGINYSNNINPVMRIHSKLYLDNWQPHINKSCVMSVINCDCTHVRPHNKCDREHHPDNHDCNHKDKCKTGLCKNSKRLFI